MLFFKPENLLDRYVQISDPRSSYLGEMGLVCELCKGDMKGMVRVEFENGERSTFSPVQLDWIN